MARKPLSILTIGGHPKDAIIASGGTMANHVAAGDRVTTLCPTHGLSHHTEAITKYKADRKMPDLEALKAELMQELVDAAAELGVTDVRILGHAAVPGQHCEAPSCSPHRHMITRHDT